MEEKYQVCIVGTKNTCRSAFVEAALNLWATESELPIEVFSCGTVDWGPLPYDRKMMEFADHFGYPMEGKAIYMTHDMLMKADLIIIFENRHRKDVQNMLDSSHWDRVFLFDELAYNQETEVRSIEREISRVYRRMYDHLDEGVQNICKKWQQSLPVKPDEKEDNN